MGAPWNQRCESPSRAPSRAARGGRRGWAGEMVFHTPIELPFGHKALNGRKYPILINSFSTSMNDAAEPPCRGYRRGLALVEMHRGYFLGRRRNAVMLTLIAVLPPMTAAVMNAPSAMAKATTPNTMIAKSPAKNCPMWVSRTIKRASRSSKVRLCSASFSNWSMILAAEPGTIRSNSSSAPGGGKGPCQPAIVVL